MRNGLGLTVLAVLAGLAAPAWAQPVGPQPGQTLTVMLTHDDADGLISVGETVTWTLRIGFEGFPVGSVASAMNAAIVASGPSLVSSSAMEYNDRLDSKSGIGANAGYNGGDSNGAGGISFVNFTNSLFIEAFGPLADRTNPFMVGAFTATALNPGVLDYAFALGPAPSAFASVDPNAFSTTSFGLEEVAFDLDTLTIVPAPASAGLLAIGCVLTAGRRGISRGLSR